MRDVRGNLHRRESASHLGSRRTLVRLFKWPFDTAKSKYSTTKKWDARENKGNERIENRWRETSTGSEIGNTNVESATPSIRETDIQKLEKEINYSSTFDDS